MAPLMGGKPIGMGTHVISLLQRGTLVTHIQARENTSSRSFSSLGVFCAALHLLPHPGSVSLGDPTKVIQPPTTELYNNMQTPPPSLTNTAVPAEALTDPPLPTEALTNPFVLPEAFTNPVVLAQGLIYSRCSL